MEAEVMVDILRRVRHDFGNNLQVILGYIDLNRPQQAREYIVDVVQKIAAERNVFECGEAQLALYLYKQLLMARDLGIILRYKELVLSSCNILESRNEPFKTLASLSPKFREMEDDPLVNVSLYEEEKGKVKMILAWPQPQAGHLEVIIEELK